MYADKFKEDPEKRDGVLNMLLPKVRWVFVPPEFLVDTVESEASIQHLPIVHQLLHETYKSASCGSNWVPKILSREPRTG